MFDAKELWHFTCDVQTTDNKALLSLEPRCTRRLHVLIYFGFRV